MLLDEVVVHLLTCLLTSCYQKNVRMLLARRWCHYNPDSRLQAIRQVSKCFPTKEGAITILTVRVVMIAETRKNASEQEEGLPSQTHGFPDQLMGFQSA